MASESVRKVYVVTGGNRGLGLGFVKSLLARQNHTVIATVRSEQAAESLQEEIATMTKGEDSLLEITQFDFSTAIPAEEVRRAISKFNIDHIDVLILNAGGVPPLVPASQTTPGDLRAAFETNAIAPLQVFQGLWPLLEKSPSLPKLIWITSSVGSIGTMDSFGGGGYGPSRAAQNWLTRSLHLEFNEAGKDAKMVAIALHPGWVQTRAGQFAVDQWQPSLKAINYAIAEPPETVETSVEGMLEVIDAATDEKSGKFMTYKGDELPW